MTFTQTGSQNSRQNSDETGRTWSSRGLVLVLFAIIVVIRWEQLASLVCDHPFWDQWDSEIASLYLPFVDHQLTWASLIAPHNEHRILFTRLFNLGLFVLNDQQFDNRVTTFANAMVYGFALGLFVRPLLRRTRPLIGLLFVSLVAFVGTLLIGWENLLSGFQNAFYFFFGISVLAFDLVTDANKRWYTPLLVLALAILALFTIASGTMLALVLAAMGVVLWRNGHWNLGRAAVFGCLCMAIALYGLWITPHVAGHDVLKAQNTATFLMGVVRNLAWPLDGRLAVAVLWFPFGWAAVQALRGDWRDRKDSQLDLFLLGVSGWVFLQAIAMAYSRALPPMVASRYTDLLAFGCVCNVALAFRMANRLEHQSRRVALAVCVVVSCVVFSAYMDRGNEGMAGALDRADLGRRQQRHLVDYIAGGGIEAWKDVPVLDLSYPSVPRLAGLLDDANVRAMLPRSIRPAMRITWPACEILSSSGTPAGFPPAPVADIHGTYRADAGKPANGRCVSETSITRFPYLQFTVTGQFPGQGLALELLSAEPARTEVAIARPDHREPWKVVNLRVPAREFHIAVEDENPESWFAFAAPVEQGRLSYVVNAISVALGNLDK